MADHSDHNDTIPSCVSCAATWGEYAPEMAGWYRTGCGTEENPYCWYPLCDECLRFSEDVVQVLVVLYTKGVRADAEGRAT